MRNVTRVRSPATVSGPWTRPWTTLEGYIYSQPFAEHRMCPCYNMMPRELLENLNCRPQPGAESISQTYLHCQAVDTTALYDEIEAKRTGFTFVAVRAPCFPRRCLRARFPHRCLRASKINMIPGA